MVPNWNQLRKRGEKMTISSDIEELKKQGIITDKDRSECEVWTRVMGYYRPTSLFNIGKKGEHEERVHFEEEATLR